MLSPPASLAQKIAEIEAEIAEFESELSMAPEGGLKEEELTELIAKRNRQLEKR